MNLAIAVAAYNRPACLTRLLDSLTRVRASHGVHLIVSIDAGGPASVGEIARRCRWPHGPVEVIEHKERLGLKGNILACGDLTEHHDAVIVLEDDLYASPELVEYARQAVDFYADDPSVGGISLYSPVHNEIPRLPFQPLHDGHDVYFMQIPSSWGQCWTRWMWRSFRDWVAENSVASRPDIPLPHSFRNWQPTSWKKEFAGFLVDTGRYFVYPRTGYTTNFGDPGAHWRDATSALQCPLVPHAAAQGHPRRFCRLSESGAVYDAWSEIEPRLIQALNPDLASLDFDIDLYGTKRHADVTRPLVATIRPGAKPTARFGLELRPHESNLIHGLPGTELGLFEADSVRRNGPLPLRRELRRGQQYFGHIPGRIVVADLLSKVLRRVPVLSRALEERPPSD